MKRLIRWQGLAAFFVVLGLLTAVTFLFLDTWLRIAIEQAGGRLAGAEINVESVEHRFSPFGLTLQGVQVTDPENPTHNRVILEELQADVSLMPLFMDKVIIDRLSATGVQFNQPRERPGRVYDTFGGAEGESLSERIASAGIEVPSIDELLEEAPLQSPRAADDVRIAYEEHQQAVRNAYEELPDSDKLEDYEQQLEALEDRELETPADLLAAREDFQALMDEIRADRQRVIDFRERLDEARNDLGARTQALESARQQDFDLLSGLVAGDAAAYSEVTEAVFGPQVDAWSRRLLTAYDLLAPMLANRRQAAQDPPRLEGRWIAYAETAALPDILVRDAEISLIWGEESFAVQLQDVTTDHETLGSPTRFVVDSDNTGRWQSLQVDGDFRFTAAGLQAGQQWDISGLVLEAMTLADDSSLSSSLQSGMLSSTGSLRVDENRLDGQAGINLSGLDINAAGDSEVTGLIADSLTSLSTLNIDTDISGDYRNPRFSLRSDLDRQLADAVMNNLSAEDQARLDELRTSINSLTEGTLEDSDQLQSRWGDWEGTADDRQSGLQELLNSSFSRLVEEEGGGLRERLQEELFGD